MIPKRFLIPAFALILFFFITATKAVSEETTTISGGGGGSSAEVAGTARFWSGGGTVEPPTQTVAIGDTATLTVTPSTNSSISTVIGCGGSLAGNSYTTAPITANCDVTATFSLNSYTLTATATPAEGDSISPDTRTVSHGDTAAFTLSPNWGYQIDSVTGCDGTRDGNIYTTGPITGACSVSAALTQVYLKQGQNHVFRPNFWQAWSLIY